LVRLCDRGLKSKKRAAVFAAVGDLLIKVENASRFSTLQMAATVDIRATRLPQVGRKGLGGASKLDQEVWDQFHAEWEGLL
jgi:hypothetical protein